MTARPFVFTGRHMLIIMVAGFSVVIAVNITLAVLASSTWSGLVAKNGYVASIDFAQNETSRRAIETRGWSVSLTAPGGLVTLEARDDAGAPLPASRTITFEPSGTIGEAEPMTLAGLDGLLRAAEPLPAGRYVLRADIGPADDKVPWRSVVVVAP